jgi:hypothetical protein
MKLESLQKEFSAHIRNPERNPPPEDVEDRRMKIYRDLFFNNIRSLLAANFPVLHTLYAKDDWDRLVRDFYADHRCRTPLFAEVAREFLRYLQDERESREDDPPFLLELAHYEWVELALDLDSRSVDDAGANPGGDLMEDRPVLTPLLHLLSYRFPVHRISPDYRPGTAPETPTHLLVWRNRADEVKFMQINEFTRLLIELLASEDTLSGRKILEQVADITGHPDVEKVMASGADLLNSLRARDIILGTRPSADV